MYIIKLIVIFYSFIESIEENFCKKYIAEFRKSFDLVTILKPIWNPVEKLWVDYIDKFQIDEFEDLNALRNASQFSTTGTRSKLISLASSL